MRRMGWFLAGAATAAAALVAVPALRDRLGGESHDDLPPAVGLDDDLEPAEVRSDEVEREPEVPVAHTDEPADELRERIDSGRERLRQKARAGTTDAEETGEIRIEPDEPPQAG